MSQKYLDNIQFKNENLKVRDTEARALIQDNANDIASLKPRMDSAEREIAGLKDRVTDTEQDVEALEGRMSTVETKNNEQDAEINSIEAEQTEQNSRISSVETKNTQQDSRLTSLESNESTIFDEISGIKAKNNAQDANLEQLNSRMQTAEGEITTINNTIVTINSTIDNIIDKNDVQDAQIADLDHRIVASTYEAGEGIYFGQGVDHTNVNIEDELLAEIHTSTAKNAEQDRRLNVIEKNYVYDVEVNTANRKTISVLKSDGAAKHEYEGSVTNTPSGSVTSTFTGSQMSIKGTPSGSVSSSGTFTGDQMSLTGTPAGSISSTATGTAVTLSAGTLPSKAADVYNASSCTYDYQTETIIFTPGTFTEGTFSAGAFPTVQSVTNPSIASSFTGDQMSLIGTPSGTVAVSSTFTGDQMSLTGTPSGTVASSFTGTEATNDVLFKDTFIPAITPITVTSSTYASPYTKKYAASDYNRGPTSGAGDFYFDAPLSGPSFMAVESNKLISSGSASSSMCIRAVATIIYKNDLPYLRVNTYRWGPYSVVAGAYRTYTATIIGMDEYGQTTNLEYTYTISIVN